MCSHGGLGGKRARTRARSRNEGVSRAGSNERPPATSGRARQGCAPLPACWWKDCGARAQLGRFKASGGCLSSAFCRRGEIRAEPALRQFAAQCTVEHSREPVPQQFRQSLADAQSSAHASCQELRDPGAFSRTAHTQKANLAPYPTPGQPKLSSPAAAACRCSTLSPLSRLFLAQADPCSHGDPRAHTNQKAGSAKAREHRVRSAAAPGNQTLIETGLIHGGFARQPFSRQDVADPV